MAAAAYTWNPHTLKDEPYIFRRGIVSGIQGKFENRSGETSGWLNPSDLGDPEGLAVAQLPNFGMADHHYRLYVWNRRLTDAEVATALQNPDAIFPDGIVNGIVPTASAVVSISRPTSDVTTSGWTGNPDNVTLFTNINETVPSNTEFIESPNITGGEFTTFNFLPTRPAGTWDVTFHARFTGASAQTRIHLLDGSNVSQGVSAWQTVTSSFVPYVASVTTTGTSSRVKIEVQ